MIGRHQPGERFFRGIIREPEGSGECVVLPKGLKALAKRIATKEAERRNWDWVVEHCRIDGEGHDQVVFVIEQWSSVGGHEIFEESRARDHA